MSAVPSVPIADKAGQATPAWKLFFQRLAGNQGGPAFDIELYRISDTEVGIRMRGADGVVRVSESITLDEPS